MREGALRSVGKGQPRIYVLREPDSGDVRYVGKTVQEGGKRYRQHLYEARDVEERTNRRLRWIGSLLDRGTAPIMEVHEIVESEAILGQREKYWVAWFRTQGADLVNGTDGGDSDWTHTDEVKERLRSLSTAQHAPRIAELTPKILELFAQGLTISEIGRALGMKQRTVKKVIDRLGVKRKRPTGRREETRRKRLDELTPHVVEMYVGGANFLSICKKLHTCQKYIRMILEENHIPIYGDNKKRCESVESIVVDKYVAGGSLTLISEETGLSVRVTTRILRENNVQIRPRGRQKRSASHA